MLLTVQGLSVDIGALHAVRDVGFTVDRGETLCIVGESGCGKSMTALALMGLLPTGARRRAIALRFRNQDLQHLTPREVNALRGDRMAMIFQEPGSALNPSYTIGTQLMEVFRRHRPDASAGDARNRALFLLERAGIADAGRRLAQYPHELSGGQRQRVMIAMALMCGPDLLIADEPTTALDTTVQAQILQLLADLQQEFGMGLLLITHDLGVVAHIADKVAVMYAGQIVETGTAAEILTAPSHPYTRGLLACLPRPGDDNLGVIPGIVPSLSGLLRGCSFRDRCDVALPACTTDPPVRAIGVNRISRCVRA